MRKGYSRGSAAEREHESGRGHTTSPSSVACFVGKTPAVSGFFATLAKPTRYRLVTRTSRRAILLDMVTADPAVAPETSAAAIARAGGPQHLEIYNTDNGRIDASAIADELAIPVADVARAIARSAPTVRKTPDAESLQRDLAPLAMLLDHLYTLFLGDIVSVRIWLNAPNRGLDGERPMHYLLSGHFDVLENIVGSIEEGFPA